MALQESRTRWRMRGESRGRVTAVSDVAGKHGNGALAARRTLSATGSLRRNRVRFSAKSLPA